MVVVQKHVRGLLRQHGSSQGVPLDNVAAGSMPEAEPEQVEVLEQ